MKISTEQWDEWFASPITDPVSAESELAGILSCMNSREIDGGIKVTSSRLWVYRRIRRLWEKTHWSREKDLNDILQVYSRKVSIFLPADLFQKIIHKPQRHDFIKWAWVRGLFGCTGSIYNPRRGYYCIMRFHNPRIASSVKDLLTGSGVTCSDRLKNGVTELAIRDLQQIIRFCSFMGLSSVADLLEQRFMLRSSRDLANKQANCDSANIRRSVETSHQHMAFISYLKENDIDIPPALEPLVTARFEHPEATLSDLGDILRPQVSKSTVKYRLKKLQTLAEEHGFFLENKN